jgi:hypothetical protein
MRLLLRVFTLLHASAMALPMAQDRPPTRAAVFDCAIAGHTT